LVGDDGDTGWASLNKGEHSADGRQQQHEGQLKPMNDMSPPPLIHRSTFIAATKMSVHHEGRGKTYNNSNVEKTSS